MAKILKHLVFGQKKNPPVPPRPDYEGNGQKSPRFAGPIYCNIPQSGTGQNVNFEQKKENENMTASGDPSVQQYASLLADFEKQELASAATPLVYGQLLALYLLFNDMPNAKFLWKRIPNAVKMTNSELGMIWNVGKKLWNRDIPGVYYHLNEDWPNHVQPILKAVEQVIQNKALQLITKAYASISVRDASALLGITQEDCIDVMPSLGWELNADREMMTLVGQEKRQEDRNYVEDRMPNLLDWAVFFEN